MAVLICNAMSWSSAQEVGDMPVSSGIYIETAKAGITLPATFSYTIADSIQNPHFQLYDTYGELVLKKKLR